MSEQLLILHTGSATKEFFPLTGTFCVKDTLSSSAENYQTLVLSEGGAAVDLCGALLEPGDGTELINILRDFVGGAKVTLSSDIRYSGAEIVHWQRLASAAKCVGLKIAVLFCVDDPASCLIDEYINAIKHDQEIRAIHQWSLGRDWRAYKALRVLDEFRDHFDLHVLANKAGGIDLFSCLGKIFGTEFLCTADVSAQVRETRPSLAVLDAVRLLNEKSLPTYVGEMFDFLRRGDRVGLLKPYADLSFRARANARFRPQIEWVLNQVSPSAPYDALDWDMEDVGERDEEELSREPYQLAFEWCLSKLHATWEAGARHIAERLRKVACEDRKQESSQFDALAYLVLNPDVLLSEIDPAKHYAEYGRHEGRPISFDADNSKFSEGETTIGSVVPQEHIVLLLAHLDMQCRNDRDLRGKSEVALLDEIDRLEERTVFLTKRLLQSTSAALSTK